MTGRQLVRRLTRGGAGLIAIGLGALPLAIAGTAQASGPTITVTSQANGGQIPPNGTDSTFGDMLSISAHVDSGTSGNLTVQGPSGRTCPTSNLSYQLNTRSADGCTGSSGQPVPNGTYVLHATETSCGGIPQSCSTTGEDTVDVTLATPPASPQGLNASYQSGTITLTWQPNTEPDLTGYAIYSRNPSGGDTLLNTLGPSCSSSCGAQYTQSTPGTYTFVIRASRSSGPGSSSTIGSGDSAPASATVPAPPPPPSPSATASASGNPSPGSGGGGSSPTPGSGGGSTMPSADPTHSRTGATSAQSTARGISRLNQTFRAFVPPPVAADAPTVTAVDPPAVEAPQSDGTYSPELPYGSRNMHQRVVLTKRTDTAGSIISAFKGTNLWKSLAGGLLLLLAAAHLGAWLRHPID